MRVVEQSDMWDSTYSYKFTPSYRCEYKEGVLNSATCNWENGKYLASIMDRIICDEIMDVKETNFKEKI